MLILYASMIDSPENLSKFEYIYKNYKNTMFSVAYNLTKNIHTSEDIVQMSLIKLIDILYKIDSEEIEKPKCKNLLITITKNTAIDLIRKECKELPLEIIELESASIKSAEDYYFDSSDYVDLIHCIDQLEDIYRDVLRLRILHHLTAKETAKVLNTNELNVNTRFMRAKRILAQKIKECKDV